MGSYGEADEMKPFDVYAALDLVSRTLQDLNRAAVWVPDKEDPCEHFFCALEFLHERRIDAESGHPRVLAFQLWNCHGDMPVAVTVRVCRFATHVPRQFNFEIVLFVAKIDEREVREIQLVAYRQAESVLVELQGALKVVNPHHRMNDF